MDLPYLSHNILRYSIWQHNQLSISFYIRNLRVDHNRYGHVRPRHPCGHRNKIQLIVHPSRRRRMVVLTCPFRRPPKSGRSHHCWRTSCSGTTCGTWSTSDTVRWHNNISDWFYGIRGVHIPCWVVQPEQPTRPPHPPMSMVPSRRVHRRS